MGSRGLGLGLLPPGIRLALVIAIISYVQYVQTFPSIIELVGLSILLLGLNLRLRFKLLFVSAVSITFAFILVGNLLFPSSTCGTDLAPPVFWSKCALDRALFFATRRITMLFFGFAWLNATDTNESAELTRRVLRPFSKRYPYDHVGLFLFTIFDRLRFEYELANQSIAVRARRRPKFWFRRSLQNVYITFLKLSAVVLRVLTNAPKIAFAIGMHGVPAGRELNSIKAIDLFVGYEQGRNVLSHINFVVREGDVVLVSGTSGSGKTTLLRAVARYIPRLSGYAQGTIRVGDETWLPSERELSETLPNLRMVTQDTYEFFLGLTVGQELSLHSSDRASIESAVKQMEISSLLCRSISTLSGGERIKVILACVLAAKSKILLLDNPLSQLDASARRAFVNGLRRYIDEVRPIVMICDRLEREIIDLVTRQFILRNGGMSEVTSRSSIAIESNTHNLISASEGKSPRVSSQPPVAGLENVTVERDGRVVLDRFTFSVLESETVAIVGPNGVGKTTAILALAGLLPLVKGSRFGFQLVGISFQMPDLQFVALRVAAELGVKGKLSGNARDEIDAFCRTEIDGLGLASDTEVLDLTSYYSRMLSISSMLQGTKVLVIDEPTIELSLEFLPRLASRIEQLKKNGVSVIVITHVSAVANLCDRVVYL